MRPRARLPSVAILVLALLVAACSDDRSPPESAPPAPDKTTAPRPDTHEASTEVVVRVDIDDKHQTMAGFGASYRVWSDPHMTGPAPALSEQDQARVVDALVGDLGLSRLRAIVQPGLEPVNDNSDPSSLDASALRYEGRRADDPARVARQFLDGGASLVFPVATRVEPWTDSPAEHAEWGLALLQRWSALGVEPAFFSPLNEPANSWAGNRSPEWFSELVASLGPRLRQAGLKTRLVIPDDLNPGEAYRRARVVLANRGARPYVGAIAYHLYGSTSEADIARVRDLGRRYGIPVWMTEFTEPKSDHWPGALAWAARMHEVIVDGDASAVDYMWAFFGDQEPAATLVSIGSRKTTGARFAPTPTYFITGHWSRFVRPGFVRVGSESSSPHVLTSAFLSPTSDQLVIVMVNQGTVAQQVRVPLPSERLQPGIEATRSTQTDQWSELPPLAPDPSGLEAVLPPQSITTIRGELR